MDPRQSLLAAWADLAPAARSTMPLRVAQATDFWWLGTSWSLFAAGQHELYVPRSPGGARLAQLDALNEDVQALREGWVFLAGTVERDGATEAVLLPLLSRPVRLVSETARRAAARSMIEGTTFTHRLRLSSDGEPELLVLVEDQDQRAQLTEAAEFGRGAFRGQFATPAMLRRMPALTRWAQQVVAASGLTDGSPLPIFTDDPVALDPSARGLRIVVGGAVFLAPEPNRPLVAASLEAWSRSSGVGRTSFATLYAAADEEEPTEVTAPPAERPVLSPLPLSPSQQRLVVAARTSGSPWCPAPRAPARPTRWRRWPWTTWRTAAAS